MTANLINKRIFITGGAGFLGGRLARTLLAAGSLAVAGGSPRPLSRVTLADRAPVPADLAAVGITRYPPGLISALDKVARFPSCRPESLPRSVTESTSRLWLAPFDRHAQDPERLGTLDLDERAAVLREL